MLLMSNSWTRLLRASALFAFTGLLGACVVRASAGPGTGTAQNNPPPPATTTATTVATAPPADTSHEIDYAGKRVKVVKGNFAFGSGQVDTLLGIVFFVPENTNKLPDLGTLDPVAAFYTRELNISPRRFDAGFPGVHDRTEWFAVRYSGKFTARANGEYDFRVVSDDGAKVWIDGALVIDNDGTHPPSEKRGRTRLNGGEHSIRVDYFQGPRWDIALQLFVTPPSQPERLFGGVI
jgi:hypothetical protein